MLRKALKLDRVHTFCDISMSQLLEKIDFLIELTLKSDHDTNQRSKITTLVSIISLSFKGLLAESDKDHK